MTGPLNLERIQDRDWISTLARWTCCKSRGHQQRSIKPRPGRVLTWTLSRPYFLRRHFSPSSLPVHVGHWLRKSRRIVFVSLPRRRMALLFPPRIQFGSLRWAWVNLFHNVLAVVCGHQPHCMYLEMLKPSYLYRSVQLYDYTMSCFWFLEISLSLPITWRPSLVNETL